MFEQEDAAVVAERIGETPVVNDGQVILLNEERVLNEMMRGENA